MKKKALFIGGTGTISTAITARVAAEGEWELTLLNRGSRPEAVPAGVKIIRPSHTYDAWCDRVIAAMEQAKASLR